MMVRNASQFVPFFDRNTFMNLAMKKNKDTRMASKAGNILLPATSCQKENKSIGIGNT